jgi:hypothetical protein
MRVSHISVIAAVSIAYAAAPTVAAAANVSGANVTAAPARAKPQEKLVCKRLQTTGTWRADKICLTKADWKKVEEQQ